MTTVDPEAWQQRVRPSVRSSLTEWEWHGLRKQYNLADGHAHHKLRDDEQQVISRVVDILAATGTASPERHERAFENAFFSLAQQSLHGGGSSSPIFHYSSSISIDVVAKALAATGRNRVALIRPTFDNLPKLLRRSGLTLLPIADELVWTDRSYLRARLKVTDALFLVAPNNPTGTEPTRAELEMVVEECLSNHCVLVVDFTFRFFSGLARWDQYDVVHKTEDLDYFLIEDTGKTWSLADLKVGILSASRRLRRVAQLVTDELLLNVSPIILQLLEQLIRLEAEHGSPDNESATSAGALVMTNRHQLRRALKETAVTFPYATSRVSVEWLQLPIDWSSVQLAAWLAEEGIAVLPGEAFYWDSPIQGDSYLRVALMRPPDYFRDAIDALAAQVTEYQRLFDKSRGEPMS
jgi:aspartate/methionine/tyrosine aminotransferase